MKLNKALEEMAIEMSIVESIIAQDAQLGRKLKIINHPYYGLKDSMGELTRYPDRNLKLSREWAEEWILLGGSLDSTDVWGISPYAGEPIFTPEEMKMILNLFGRFDYIDYPEHRMILDAGLVPKTQVEYHRAASGAFRKKESGSNRSILSLGWMSNVKYLRHCGQLGTILTEEMFLREKLEYEELKSLEEYIPESTLDIPSTLTLGSIRTELCFSGTAEFLRDTLEECYKGIEFFENWEDVPSEVLERPWPLSKAVRMRIQGMAGALLNCNVFDDVLELNGNYSKWSDFIDTNDWYRPDGQDDIVYKEQYRVVERKSNGSKVLLAETGWNGHEEQPVKVVTEGEKEVELVLKEKGL